VSGPRIACRVPTGSRIARWWQGLLDDPTTNASSELKRAVEFYLDYGEELPRLHEAIMELSARLRQLELGVAPTPSQGEGLRHDIPDEVRNEFANRAPRGKSFS
jgi:hypothetical protein